MTNSPKIYFITKDGKFYNSIDKYYYPSMFNANCSRNRHALVKLINEVEQFKDCEIYETTEQELMEQHQARITGLVMAGEYFCKQLEFFAYSIPTISQVNKNLHQKCKIAIEALKPFSSIHKEFLEVTEDLTDDVSGWYAEFIQAVGSVKIYETKDISATIDVYHQSQSSVMGIVKKVLNNKKQ